MKSISTLDMSRTDWLRERQKGIGGSDVAAILGLNKWKTPLEVYEEKIAPEPTEIPDNPRMKAGRIMEDVIAKLWADENNQKIQKDNKIRYHLSIPFFLVNLDRIVCANGRGTGILECKNTTSLAFKHWEDDGLPMGVYAQIQHQFSVTGHEWGAVATFIDGWKLDTLDVVPDKEFIQGMNEQLKHFWNDHVLKHVPPEPTTDEEIKSLYPVSGPDTILEATEETADLCAQIKISGGQKKFYEDQGKTLKIQLKAVIGNNEILKYAGNVLATYKSPKDKRCFDMEKFKIDHPALVVDYTETKPGSRRLLVKEVK